MFLDADGEVVDRAGYDTACLRPDEKKGSPVLAMERFATILKNRPTGYQMKDYPFLDAAAMTEKTGQPLLVLITRPESKLAAETRERLLKSSKLAKFVNTNMAFVNLTWPDDADVSPQAKWFRTFVEVHKIGPAPIQAVVLSYGARKVQHKVLVIDQVDGLINTLAQHLPRFDYGGKWLTDYRQAQSISAQTQRDMLLSFTSYDSSEWCQKLDTEIYQKEAFKEYAKKNLVLVRVDFPKNPPEGAKGETTAEATAGSAAGATVNVSDSGGGDGTTTADGEKPRKKKKKKDGPSPEVIREQNEALAELYGIRGYPTIIVLNPDGERIAQSKYMEGGPGPFLDQLNRVIQLDRQRRRPIDDGEEDDVRVLPKITEE